MLEHFFFKRSNTRPLEILKTSTVFLTPICTYAHTDACGAAHSRLLGAIAAHQQRTQRHFLCELPVDPHTVYCPGLAPWRHLYTSPQVRKHVVDTCMTHMSTPGSSRQFMRSHIFTTHPKLSEPFMRLRCDGAHAHSAPRGASRYGLV